MGRIAAVAPRARVRPAQHSDEEVDMAEGNGKVRRPKKPLTRAMEWLDRWYWARDDDIARKMNWQIFRGRRGRREYRDLRFDVLIIVRETQARKAAAVLGRSPISGPGSGFGPGFGSGFGPGGIGGFPSSGPFYRG